MKIDISIMKTIILIFLKLEFDTWYLTLKIVISIIYKIIWISNFCNISNFTVITNIDVMFNKLLYL